MSRILDQDGQLTIYFDDSFESNEKDSSTYCLTITTRSAKVLHPGSNIRMEEEINVEEKLSPNLGLAHEKVIDDASTKEVDEELKLEIKFRVIEEEVIFKVDRGIMLPQRFACISVHDELDNMEEVLDPIKEKDDLEGILTTILRDDDLIDDIKEHGEAVNSLEGLGYYSYKPRKLLLDLEN
ncbi:hypothetical protein HAX54_003036 [Datura stramonium]|uniref:Uncharacterized protein n=1 Tax=Datura stramonium TaxID=4076 RepID=A0ABS8WUH0_DATST|nr:hypothetical protein [Datura stramonium]